MVGTENEISETYFRNNHFRCAASEKQKDELCEIFEERLKEQQGEIDSQKLKHNELNELYSEVMDKYESAESRTEAMAFERDELLMKLESEKSFIADLQQTNATLQSGHSLELENLRQKVEDGQKAYTHLEENYSMMKEEYSQLANCLETKDGPSAEWVNQGNKPPTEIVGENKDLEHLVASLKEEKRDWEQKEKQLRENLHKKSADVHSLKNAVKRYESELDELQHELSRERQLRKENEDKDESYGCQERSDSSREVEQLRRLLDAESAKCLRLGAELKNFEDIHRNYDVLRESLETEKYKSARLESTIQAITEDEETIALKKALSEAQAKIENLEHTVELLKENNKVIGELRKELEEEKSGVRANYDSPREERPGEDMDELKRELLLEKARRNEIEQLYHSLKSHADLQQLKLVLCFCRQRPRNSGLRPLLNICQMRALCSTSH